MTDCIHEKHLPKGEDNDWDLMNWDEHPTAKGLYVNMCKKCHLLYWEIRGND